MAITADYPYPVLVPGSEDYIEGCFFDLDFNGDVFVDETDIVAPIEFKLNCPLLESFIENNLAIVAISIRSNAASYSRLHLFDPGSKSMITKIGKNDAVGKIEYETLILATNADELDGSSPSLNSLYFDGEKFPLRKGDVLARSGVQVVFIDDSELEKPLSSIFSVSDGGNEMERSILPRFDDEKIDILLRSDLYGLYYDYAFNNARALERYVTGIIVFPVLVEAISLISTTGDAYQEKRWYRAIEKKANEKGFDVYDLGDPATTVADALLGEVAFGSLQSFRETVEAELNSGETEMIGGID